MADHWKSLANLLGAPGMEEPEEAVETEVPTNEVLEPASQPTETSSEAEGFQHEQGPQEQDKLQQDEERTSEAVKPSPPEVIQAVAAKVPHDKTSSKERPVTKRKKRSSTWEALASMFDIKIERSEEIEAEQENDDVIATPKQTANDVRDQSEVPAASDVATDIEDSGFEEDAGYDIAGEPTPLTIFDEQADSNPALEEMFGDARKSSSDDWHANRRIVDDIGWDDDFGDESPDEPIGDSSKDKDDVTVRDDALKAPERELPDEGEETERPRRGRRRRRGSRTRRDEERLDEPSKAAEISGDDLDPWDVVDDSNLSPAGWAEPDSFEGDDEGETGEVERRSSRRRRGRARSDDSGLDQDKTPRPRERTEVGDARDEDVSERRPAARGRGERGRGERGRGEREPRKLDRDEPQGRQRRRPEEPRGAEPPTRKVASDEVSASEPESMDDEIRPGAQHRNIPTWIEALQAIIDANADNHRKNENRGGPRGRPRGRR